MSCPGALKWVLPSWKVFDKLTELIDPSVPRGCCQDNKRVEWAGNLGVAWRPRGEHHYKGDPPFHKRTPDVTRISISLHTLRPPEKGINAILPATSESRSHFRPVNFRPPLPTTSFTTCSPPFKWSRPQSLTDFLWLLLHSIRKIHRRENPLIHNSSKGKFNDCFIL